MRARTRPAPGRVRAARVPGRLRAGRQNCVENLQGDESHLRRKTRVFFGRDIKKTFDSSLESLLLLDDIRLFRAVVLVDQFLVALPDQASVGLQACDELLRELCAARFGISTSPSLSLSMSPVAARRGGARPTPSVPDRARPARVGLAKVPDAHGGRSSGARCGCVIRARRLARSETTLPRRRRPRGLARRAHRPVRDVRR
jgi:hypothetical protein